MISIEGIDKSGKGTVAKYIKLLGNHRHVLLDRGPLSNYMFSQMDHRGYEYDISSYKSILFVFLDVAYADWDVRCRACHEPSICYADHYANYDAAIQEFTQAGCTVLRFNTTDMTPYNIALSVMHAFDNHNNEYRDEEG